jgi:hypothetical protein
MKTTWNIKTIVKTHSDDEYHEIRFKDYRGEHTIKIDNLRQLIEDLDKKANYKERVKL